MSRRVFFIRHALPVVDKTVSSRLWPLSEEGRAAAQDLAERLQLPENAYVVSSDELKAKETAEAFSDRVVVDDRVQEVSRPWTDGDYKSIARDWLNGEQVEGWEPRQAVLERMGEAVDEALEKAEGPVIVTTHGMAMSTYITSVVQVDPVFFWSELGFPDARVLDLGARQVHSLDQSRERPIDEETE